MTCKQKVYLSMTLSGRFGFFTARCLVIALPKDEYFALLEDKEKASAKAEALGFQFEERQ